MAHALRVAHALDEVRELVAQLVVQSYALGALHEVRLREARPRVVRHLVVLRRVAPLREGQVQWIASVRCQQWRSLVRQQCAQVLRPCQARPLSLGR